MADYLHTGQHSVKDHQTQILRSRAMRELTLKFCQHCNCRDRVFFGPECSICHQTKEEN